MIRAADYRARAEHCARSAKAAQDDYHRKNFQKLAEMWSEMAAKAESRERSEQRRVEEALATIRHAEALAAQGGQN